MEFSRVPSDRLLRQVQDAYGACSEVIAQTWRGPLTDPLQGLELRAEALKVYRQLQLSSEESDRVLRACVRACELREQLERLRSAPQEASSYTLNLSIKERRGLRSDLTAAMAHGSDWNVFIGYDDAPTRDRRGFREPGVALHVSPARLVERGLHDQWRVRASEFWYSIEGRAPVVEPLIGLRYRQEVFHYKHDALEDPVYQIVVSSQHPDASAAGQSVTEALRALSRARAPFSEEEVKVRIARWRATLSSQGGLLHEASASEEQW